jgi:hypothetical protein
MVLWNIATHSITQRVRLECIVPRIVIEGFTLRVYTDDHQPAHVHVLRGWSGDSSLLTRSSTVRKRRGAHVCLGYPPGTTYRRRTPRRAVATLENVSPMKALRARSAVVSRDGKTLVLTVRLVGGTRVAFPVSRVRGNTAARSRSAESIFDVKVEDRGASIVWPSLDIDFSVAECCPSISG